MATAQTQVQRPRKERKDNADRRRKQLIEATLRSVVANGLGKTTLATVATEAGLSQGVAVFYFKSKDGLLAAALEHQYALYAETWEAELAGAGDDAVDRLLALIRADFSPVVCNREALAIWFAFWGEAKFHPQYAETARDFDDRRGAEIARVCADLMPGAAPDDIQAAATCIDAATDGLWQKLYLAPDGLDRGEALAMTLRLLAQMFPDHAGRLAPG